MMIDVKKDMVGDLTARERSGFVNNALDVTSLALTTTTTTTSLAPTSLTAMTAATVLAFVRQRPRH